MTHINIYNTWQTHLWFVYDIHTTRYELLQGELISNILRRDISYVKTHRLLREMESLMDYFLIDDSDSIQKFVTNLKHIDNTK
jgi:hypothetical protein